MIFILDFNPDLIVRQLLQGGYYLLLYFLLADWHADRLYLTGIEKMKEEVKIFENVLFCSGS